MPARYKAKSGGIVATMEDMLEKAKAELADGQKAEMNAKFDFDMLKQKLEDAVAVRRIIFRFNENGAIDLAIASASAAG